MKAERPGGLFRRATIAAAIVAPLLLLGAVAALAQEKKPEVGVGDQDLSPCGASPRAKTDREKFCLRGRVRIVTTEARTAHAQDGALVEDPLYSVIRHTYDERGNVTLAELSDTSNGPGPVGVIFRRGVSSFDAQGRMTSSKWFEPVTNEPASAVTYTYDEHGNRVKIDSWRTKPDAHMVWESSFDAEGHEVEITTSNLTPDGWKTTKSKNVTTVEGGLTIVRTYSPDDVLRGRTEVLRDGRGHVLSEELYLADARGEEHLRRKVAYNYDERGLLREVIYHKAEAWLGGRAVYDYNEQGDCISLSKYNADGSFAIALHARYEYDAAGNWVTRVSFSRWRENLAPEPFSVARRRITYY